MFASQLLGKQGSLLLHEERRELVFWAGFIPASLQEGRAWGSQTGVRCCSSVLGAHMQPFTARGIH